MGGESQLHHVINQGGWGHGMDASEIANDVIKRDLQYAKKGDDLRDAVIAHMGQDDYNKYGGT